MTLTNFVLFFIHGLMLSFAYDPRDLVGFLDAVGPPAPQEPIMYCPGRCNPICSPSCALSCCSNSELSPPHWENLALTQTRAGMGARRSHIPDPTREETKTVYGCQSKQLSIKCKNRSHKLVITKAFYGRDKTDVCKHPVLPYEAYCRGQEDLILKKVQNLCSGENQCSIAVKDGLLVRKGTVLCPQVYKYLQVDYICTQHPDIYDKKFKD